MALDGKDRAFRCDSISRIDYKTLTMDRVLTAFLARLWHDGVPSRMSRYRGLSSSSGRSSVSNSGSRRVQ